MHPMEYLSYRPLKELLSKWNQCFRMRELSVQSANGIYTTEDRIAIQAEIDQLNEEITRISETTEFNTMTLLDGNIDRKSFSSNNSVSLISLSDTVEVGDYSIKITQDARQAVIVGNAVVLGDGETTATRKIGEDEAGSININGETVKVNVGDTVDEVFQKIRDSCDNVNVNVFAVDTHLIDDETYPVTDENLEMAGYSSKQMKNGDSLVFVTRDYGSDQKIDIHCDKPGLCELLGLTVSGAQAYGTDAKANVVFGSDSLFENTATVSIRGNKVTVSDRNNFKMVFEVDPGTVGTKFEDARIIDAASDPTDGSIT